MLRRLVVVLLSFALSSALLPPVGAAGPVFLTGHDPDFHAQGSAGAQNLLRAGLDFVTGGTYDLDDGNKFLWVESRGSVPGGHLIGENGLGAIGLQLGVHYERANGAEFMTADIGPFTAIVVASSFGGLLSRAELDALIAREDDLREFINAGGGLMAMSECFPCGANLLDGPTPPDLFGFLPVEVTSIGANPPFTVTPFGAGAPFFLTDSDLNDPTHNSFGETGGLETVDLDSAGSPTTLAGFVFVGTELTQIMLAPETASRMVGEDHTVTATIIDPLGAPVADTTVTFAVVSGPNAGDGGASNTDTAGMAGFTYTGDGGAGTDTIEASFLDMDGTTQVSNQATVDWDDSGNQPPNITCEEPAVENDPGMCSAAVACEQVAFCSDPEGAEVTLTCAPPPPYPVGATDVTVTCDDGQATSEEVCPVTVLDSEAPVITCPPDVVLECPADTSPANTGSATATDNCAVATVEFADDSVPGCGGTETITRTWTATDEAGNEASCAQVIEEVDTTPPAVTCAVGRGTLWPPNHKFRNVMFSFTAVDTCDPDPPTIELSTTSDEHPATARGAGGPNHCPDALIDGDDVWLRAERSGPEDGRVYTVLVSATDACGNVGVCGAPVEVPKSMGRNGAAVDSGQSFDPSRCAQGENAESGDPAITTGPLPERLRGREGREDAGRRDSRRAEPSGRVKRPRSR